MVITYSVASVFYATLRSVRHHFRLTFYFLLYFQVWSAVRKLARTFYQCYLRVCLFCFSGCRVVTCGSTYFSLIQFHSLSLWCFEQFRLRFGYLDLDTSIYGISITHAVFVFCFFQPVALQRPWFCSYVIVAVVSCLTSSCGSSIVSISTFGSQVCFSFIG